MKKKNIIIIIVILLLIILFVPMQINKLKDGGTVEYKTLLYSITKYHKLDESVNDGYIDGIVIKVFGKEIYNSIEDKENTNKDNEESLDNTENSQYSSFVGTILEETTTYMIVEPNEDEIERKSADKIKINYGTDHIDYLYGIGRKVVIYYTGYIMESDSAQINTDKISTEGYEDFKIEVKASDKTETKKILNNKDLSADKQDYNLYFYGLEEVSVTVNNETMSLEKALKSGKITIEGIIQKANKDEKDGKIKADMYKEGGSKEYHYDNYTIIKMHSLDGNRDVYIGVPNMNLNDLKF